MRRRLLLLTLLALHLGPRLLLWTRPVRELDDLVLPDDAYLSLHLARSIAQGDGPFYGLAPTNGFQPLYVFLMAPVFALVEGDLLAPVRIAQLLLIAADALALALVLALLLRLGCSIAAVALAGWAWCLSPYSIATSLNGLETSLAAAAIAAVLLQWERLRSDRAGPPGWALLGALAGIAFLARIDTLLLLPPLLASLALRRDPGATMRRHAPGLAIAAAVALLVALPWLAYSWHWTHSLFPVSGRAVRHLNLSNVGHAPDLANLYLPMLARAARAVARHLGFLLLAVAAVAAAAAALRRARGGARTPAPGRAWLAPLAGYGTLLVAAYALVVFAPWYFPRYFYPLLIPVVIALALAADRLLGAVRPARRAALAVALLALIAAGSLADPRTGALFRSGPPPPWGYLRIGEWARDSLPAGAVIGGSQTGAIGYFAERHTVVNLDGVVNRDAYQAMRAGRLLDYVRAAGVEWLLWQDDIEFLERESRRGTPVAVEHVREIEGIRTGDWPWHLYRVVR